MKTKAFTLLLLGALIQPAWAALPETVQVHLFSAYPPARTLTLEGPFRMRAPSPRNFPTGKYMVTLSRGQLRFQRQRISSLVIERTGSVPGVQAGALPTRHYTGQLIFRAEPNGIRILNRVPAKTYVSLVVASETMPGWPAEALKAQAVLTQTRLSRQAAADVQEDSTSQEAYLGSDHQRPEVDRAVTAVWGQNLLYQHRPIIPFYHASCGGRTSDGRFLNAAHPPAYLSSVPCPYCKNAPFARETRRIIPEKQWGKTFAGLPEVLKTDPAGRPLEIKLTYQPIMSGYAFWLKLGQAFGWDKAPGTRLQLGRLANGDIEVKSNGAGHGLGLCQWGARRMAEQGKSYREILKFYFPLVSLSR